MRPIILIALLCALLPACNSASDDANNTTTQGPVTPTATSVVNTDSKNAIAVDDQVVDLEADSVTIKSVVADEPGFVVIYDTKSGRPSTVLGSTPVDGGESLDLSVGLSRDVEQGELLVAILHVDRGQMAADGQARMFEFQDAQGGDPPAIGKDGGLVTAPFSVSIEGDMITPSLNVEDQELALEASRSVLFVKNVTVPAQGFVAIYAQKDDALGDFLGSRLLEQGETMDVEVTLNRDVVDGETLYARVHLDSPQDEKFNFGAEDGEDPVVNLADEMPLQSTFIVTLAKVVPLLEVDAPTYMAGGDLTKFLVKTIQIPADGYVAIFEDNGSGASGALLGFKELLAGTSQNVPVDLNRDVQDQETLYVRLHNDDPADKMLTFDGQNGEDLPVKDAMDNDVVTSVAVSVMAPETNTLTAEDQTLSGVSTQVTIKAANLLADGFVVVFVDDGTGAPGEQLGAALLTQGSAQDVVVTLSRPLVTGEKLIARLHTDMPADGAFTGGAEDLPVKGADDMEITSPLEVTVPAKLPAVLAEVTNMGATGYLVTKVTPEGFLGQPAGDAMLEDPALSLRLGWRYQFNNASALNHPLEFGTIDAALDGSTDVILLSQGAGVGTLEADVDVDWVDEGGNVSFNYTAAIEPLMTGYRCSVHPAMMRGSIATSSGN